MQLVEAAVPKPVTVKFAGSASEAVVSTLITVPLGEPVHDRLTVTSAALLSEKSLPTVNVAVWSVLVNVHVTVSPACNEIAPTGDPSEHDTDS